MAGCDDRASPITMELNARRWSVDVDFLVNDRAVGQSREAVRKIAGAAEGDVVCDIDVVAWNDALARAGWRHGQPGREFFEHLHDDPAASAMPIF